MSQADLRRRVISPWWSPLVLVLAGVFLAVRWDRIPEQWIVHWGIGGVPNGWAQKSVLGVYAPLIGGGLLWVLMEAIAAVARARDEKDEARAALLGASTRMLRLVSLATSLLFALLAVTLPLGPRLGPGPIVLLAIGLLLGSVVIGASSLSRALERARSEGHAERLKGYQGLYYSNPEDARLWVPKLIGVGWTINFAHPLAWPMTAVVALLPVLLAWVVLRASSR
jgi:uncharacterized membrane protein